jgi:hypothetical protein
MGKQLIFYIFIGFLIAPKVFAISVLSTDSGPSQQSIKQGVSDGIFDTMAKHAGDWVSNGMNKIGDWALQTLFGIYDKYIGTFLIYIPNLASPNTYTALANNLGAVNTGANAVQVVLNILKITSGTGLFILIVGFVIDTGQRSSGLWNRVVDPNLVLGFVAAFLCLFGWPTILSYMTTGVTAMGYYLYNQNTLRTSGVLEGFQNIDINAGGGNNAYQLSQYDFRGNLIMVQGMTWNLIYLVSLGLVVIGFYNCYSAVSAGESQKGNYRFFQAMAGIILILGMPTLVHVLISKGADTIGNQPVIPGQTLPTYSLQGLIQSNGVQYPQQSGQASTNIGTAGNTAAGPPTSRLAVFSAGLLKCGVAIWGLIICFAVIFAKFFQVLNLWVLFVLGPIFIGCLGHPATAPIFWGAARYFIKLLLYSVIWAITLVGLYLIPNINWGIETIGVNSLLTAVAVLAGLQLIANVQEFASLFTTFSGANLKGEGYKEFTRDTKAAVGGANQARLGTFGVMKNMTGETGQAMGAAAGAAVASVIPGVGTAGGALAGQKTMKGLNAVAKLGGMGGKPKYSNPDNPVSSFLKKMSGASIAGSLKGDGKNFDNLTSNEKEKHKLVSNYAQKLQKGKESYKPKSGNQGSQGKRTV